MKNKDIIVWINENKNDKNKINVSNNDLIINKDYNEKIKFSFSRVNFLIDQIITSDSDGVVLVKSYILSYLKSFINGESKVLSLWGKNLINNVFGNITETNGNSLIAMICLILFRSMNSDNNLILKWFSIDSEGGCDILNNNIDISFL